MSFSPQPSSQEVPPPPEPVVSKNLDYVDALRGIAILLVIFVHTGGRTPLGSVFEVCSRYGQYGVQLFFVMSAFTLAMSLDRLPSFGVRDYRDFMTRRFFRIAPLYYLGIVFYGAFTFLSFRLFHYTPFTQPADYSGLKVVANLLFLHGLLPTGNSDVVPGGWSIGCEFLFYSFMPFLFLMAKARRFVLLATLFLSVALTLGFHYLAVNVLHIPTGLNSSPYFSVVCQYPCFVAGICYFFYHENPGFRKGMLLIGLPSAALLVFSHDRPWGWIAAPFFASAASVALACSLERRRIPGVLRKIGQLSFSMYLWHFVVIWMLNFAIKKFPPPASEITNVVEYGVVLAITICVSAVTFRWVETPGIRLGRFCISRMGRRAIAPAGAVSS